VNEAVGEPLGALLWRRWHDPAAWTETSDFFLVLMALSLPWSTTLTSIFMAAALITMAPFFDAKAFMRSLRHPASIFPVALFGLAAVGMLWSDAPWGGRFFAVGPASKLLMVPLLFYHAERSTRGVQFFKAFLVSCIVLMAMSWLVAYDPRLALKQGAEYGVPIKNYIDQSQEFALCAVALTYPVLSMLRAGRIWPALLLGAIAFSFVVNMAFVVISRTVLVTMPAMLVIFGLMHLRWRANLAILAAAAALVVLTWFASPQLQRKVYSIGSEYQLYSEQGAVTSIGQRLEYWRKSLRFFADAPVAGHGTGSTEMLFQQAAIGQTGVAAQVIRNPHNQTLNVAVQWGTLGVVALYAMWLSHLMLFRGDGPMAWIGLLVVVQNVLTSLFNSHIFDFNEGWMYVLGVGIAGGMVLKARATETLEAAGAS
jgi:O-antigen ligase